MDKIVQIPEFDDCDLAFYANGRVKLENHILTKWWEKIIWRVFQSIFVMKWRMNGDEAQFRLTWPLTWIMYVILRRSEEFSEVTYEEITEWKYIMDEEAKQLKDAIKEHINEQTEKSLFGDKK